MIDCQECAYWVDGRCRRHAPQPTPVPRDLLEKQGDPRLMVLWPQTTGGCGEGKRLGAR